MEELKKKLQSVACDLSIAMEEWEMGDPDYMDNTCCRIQTLIYELQDLYPQLCEQANNVRYGWA